ncbi:MAG: hypothetical protein LBE59_06115, partial [Nevskiaceae bacterium]|nr:hypothetical protein [Nevskiaceae bacterium]
MSRPHSIAWRRIALRCASLLLMFAPLFVSAQELQFQTPATPNDAATAAAMRDLAARVLPVYEERDTDRFLERLSIIQAVAGDYAPARSSRQSLRTRRPADATADADGQGAGIARLLDITIHALALQRDSGRPFEQTFGDAVREAITPLSDLQAFAITGWRAPPLRELEQELQQDFDRQRGRSTIALADAVDLLRGYFLFDAQRRFAAPLRALASEDERRRYVFESVRVPAANGVQLQAQVVRPKNSARAMPA